MRVGASFIHALRRVMGLDPPGRNIDVIEDDVFITSYPRSGNTWLRFILANLIRSDLEHSFATLRSVVPDMYRTPARELRRIESPRLIKSHEYFDPRYPRVVYLVRDPRDVAVSYFHYALRQRQSAAEEGIEEWVRSFVSRRTSVYGTWAEHVESWINPLGQTPDFLLIRYERLREKPFEEVRSLARFLNLSDDKESIQSSLARSSLEELRKIETATREAIPGTTVRRGETGAWVDELSPEAVSLIERAFGATMRKLGYLT